MLADPAKRNVRLDELNEVDAWPILAGACDQLVAVKLRDLVLVVSDLDVVERTQTSSSNHDKILTLERDDGFSHDKYQQVAFLLLLDLFLIGE